MSHTDPRRTVWVIEAHTSTEREMEPLAGSAIAIAIKMPEKPWQNYLVTCAHVVKSFVNINQASGPLHTNIIARPPFKGLVPWNAGAIWPAAENDGIFTGKVVDLFGRSNGDWNEADCARERDWVLIEIHETQFQSFETSLFVDPNETHTEFFVIGYPDGINGYGPGDQLIPKRSQGLRRDRESNTSFVMQLDGGDATAGGMSGGGLFDANGALTGIYFGQTKDDETRYAVDIRRITMEFDRLVIEYRYAKRISKFNWSLLDYGFVLAYFLFVLVVCWLPSITPVWPQRSLLALSSLVICIATMLGLGLIPIQLNKWKQLLIAMSFVAVLLVSVTFFYVNLRQNCVRWLTDQFVTVGYDNAPSSLTKEARILTQATVPMPMTTDDYLKNFHKADLIWTPESLEKSTRMLFGSWICLHALLSALFFLGLKYWRIRRLSSRPAIHSD